MKLLRFPIIKLTLGLITGILLGRQLRISFTETVYLAGAFVFTLGLLLLFFRSKVNTLLFDVVSILTMVSLGMLSLSFHDDRLDDRHYVLFEIDQNQLYTIAFKIDERLKPDRYNDKYIIELQGINSEIATGKVLLNISKDSLPLNLKVDNNYVTVATFEALPKPLNPHQFDYGKFLRNREIYSQFKIQRHELLQQPSDETSIYGIADQFRETIITKLEDSGFEKEPLSILKSLLLGQRQDIDSEIYNTYVNAGTIHILAVSGLHVGIILLILQFVLRPLNYVKYGRIFRMVFIIIFLWTFAIVAGLSPSVIRAVTMFTVFAITLNLKRPSNVYNNLFISAFIVLLIHPRFLFEVGFQLSYLAVLGIVSIKPLFDKLWRPKFYPVKLFWDAFTVTVSAQVGVLPISLFYFHQFPGLFFISNTLIIPFLALILGFGILVIVLALLNILPEFIVTSFSFVITSLNDFIAWVAEFENFLFKDIPFGLWHAIALYLVILASVQLFRKAHFATFRNLMIALVLFGGVLIYTKQQYSSDELIIFHKSRQTLIAEKSGREIKVFHTMDSLSKSKDQTIKTYKVGEFISELKEDSLRNVFQMKNKTLLVVDSLSSYKVKSFRPDYILLTQSPKLNLERLIDSLQPQCIIADGNNYKSYVLRWKGTSERKKIPFHSTYEKGFYSIK
ncbi:ComEC/Rec2 family competence protein [Winogradskyella maritima]|uniref:ComEC/Rec2 family competence protein n=1 Tax=Winogradskyella maritima TaxID=1517766 RepID=A0ABV8AFL1_9FLAO|nr:ComEC/Rec2 family competence protein [Winogradskyella maritima]